MGEPHVCEGCGGVFPSVFELRRHQYGHDRRCEPAAEERPVTYTCANCNETFPYADEWTDDDARREATVNGFDPDGDVVVVCDDCYQKMMAARPTIDFFYPEASS